MTKCPNCGSTAQVKQISAHYYEDSWEITVIRDYTCGCGASFTGTSVFRCEEQYEIIEEKNVH